MGFKRLVSLVCDGPCGKVVASTDKAPWGWVKVQISLYEKLDQGQKPSRAPMSAWLCPDCFNRMQEALEKLHFDLSSKPEETASREAK